jgi:hypothetical protein
VVALQHSRFPKILDRFLDSFLKIEARFPSRITLEELPNPAWKPPVPLLVRRTGVDLEFVVADDALDIGIPRPPFPASDCARQMKMKYWEIIADRLSNAGWSWGYTSLIDSDGQMLFKVDAHCDDGRRYIVRADELLIAFLELEAMLLL